MVEPGLGDVFLLMGASGVGKTAVSYRLARHLGIGITEVDDFQQIVETVTDPDRYPVFHLFRRTPEVFFAMDEAARLEHAIAYATALATPLERVIANHLESGPPLLLEGDFIHPDLVDMRRYADVACRGVVRGLVLWDEEAQIARNFLAREGEEQGERAGNSWRYSEWIRVEARSRGIPEVWARPWDTVLERAIEAITGG